MTMSSTGRGKKKLDDPEVDVTSATATARSGMALSPKEKEEKNMDRTGAILIACLMTLPFLVFLFGGRAGAAAVWQGATNLTMTGGLTNASRRPTTGATMVDELLGGLLVPSFDRGACLSRYQSAQYYKYSPYPPSSYLLHRLREYEARHRKCGPGTVHYGKSIQQLKSDRSLALMDCNYLVWLPYNGLGNRMLSLASAFLYAVLTGRVLLIRATDDFIDLFCEPFPGTTWVLPPDFPVANLNTLGVNSEQSYGNLVGRKKIVNDPAKVTAESLPPYVYLHLAHDFHYADTLFYCSDDQAVLGKVNWLLLQSDLYFVPSLYSIPEFVDELRWLFPAKESVFHLLGRYLFHPTNSVWGMVTRYYSSYLAQAKERIGVQIRMFAFASIPADDMYKQLLACSRQEDILPDIVGDEADMGNVGADGSKAILIASLHADYYERIKSMYYEHAASAGHLVSVFQPTHEERQSTERRSHNQKALAEIYLLSFSDVLLTSGMSTFGAVSTGLAALRPAMLLTAHGHKVPETPCVRAVSMEPCFHKPPDVKCQGKNVSKEELARYVKACEDLPTGTKLFD